MKRGAKNSHTFYPWPINLGCAVFGEDITASLPDDYSESISFVLDTLTERERRVLEMRFKERLTLSETASVMGLTSRERPRQIEMKALRKMRHPSRSKVLRYGLANYRVKTEQIAASAGVREVIEGGKSLDDFSEKLDEMSVDELGLTTRAYNCLVRSGRTTVSHILQTTRTELYNIRNLGAISAQQIEDILAKLGLSFKKE